jgi:hypothetical protein
MSGPFDGANYFSSARVTPGAQPTPNSEPMGAITGTPVRTRTFSRPVQPGAAQVIVSETRENRIAFITTPAVGFTFFVGEAGVTPDVGMPLAPGQVTEVPLPGFQPLYICHNGPVPIRVGIAISAILMAERERRL